MSLIRQGMKRRVFNKPIRVSPKEKRTYNDVVYDSIAEMKRSCVLDMMVAAADIQAWFRQVPFQLGPDTVWRADFVVIDLPQHDEDGPIHIHIEDVKQFETPASRRIKKLWKKYGPYDLHIIGLRSGDIVIRAAVRRKA